MKNTTCGAILFLVLSVCLSIHAVRRKNIRKNMMPENGFTMTSSAFTHNGAIPIKYTCDGENISPDLQWSGEPSGTQSFALIVDDPDAPEKVWVHWIVYNIPTTVREFPIGLMVGSDTFAYAVGYNDFDTAQYGGPCPPSGAHRYQFTLYALDAMLPVVRSKVTKNRLLNFMEGHILGQTTLIGTYARSE